MLQKDKFREDSSTLKQALDKQFSKTTSETPATYISLFNTLCELGTCTLMTEQGIPVQFDLTG